MAAPATGKRTLIEGVAPQLPGPPPNELLRHGPDGPGIVQRKPVDAGDGNIVAVAHAAAPGGAGPAAAPAHAAPAHQVAERDGINAVITVIARAPDGSVLARWRARGRWDGPLPARYHGSRGAAAWTWSDPAARATRLHTQADGSGGELVERWAAQHGAATVDVVASAVDAAGPQDEASDALAAPSG